MNERLDEIKILVVTGFGALTSLLGVLAIPVYILVFSNITDYATALMAVESRGQVKSSAIGIRGIIKKISMWLLIVVGALIDQLMLYASDMVGITLPFNFLVACIVAMWLCANEILSILENISDILGDDMPSFLIPLVKNIRSQVENKIDSGEDK